jgi:hypothetical protein
MTAIIQSDREETEFTLLGQSIKVGSGSGLKRSFAG